MLGTVQFGLDYGIANQAGKPSYDAAREILKAAFDAGIDSLDTAAAYGDSEAVIGRALAELGLTDPFFIVTKIPARPADLPASNIPDWVDRHLAESRRNLRLDVLPMVLLHREDDFDACFDALERAVQRGEIIAAGVSAGSNPQGTRRLVDTGRLDALQVPVNLFDRRFREETGTLRAAAEGNLPVFARSALLQGLAVMPVEAVKRKGEYFSAYLTLREKVDSLAQDAGLTPAELALRFVLSLDGVRRLLFGVDTLEQLRQNVAIASQGPLDADLAQAVDAIVPSLPPALTDPARWPDT